MITVHYETQYEIQIERDGGGDTLDFFSRIAYGIQLDGKPNICNIEEDARCIVKLFRKLGYIFKITRVIYSRWETVTSIKPKTTVEHIAIERVDVTDHPSFKATPLD